MKNIALVVPSTTVHKQIYKEYPLGVGYIGTVLKEHGFNVKIIDQAIEELSNDCLLEKLKEFKVDVIGFSMISATMQNTSEIIKLIRDSEYENIPLLAGGIHPSLYPLETLQIGFDVVIKGEGESKIIPVIESLLNNKSLGNIPGIVYKDNNNKVHNTEDVIKCVRLDELPIVDRSIYNIDLYSHHSIAASRGCYYRCKFCCNYSGTLLNDGVSVRSIDNVIKEIEYLQENFAAKDIFFVDDIFFLKKERIIEFCEEIVSRKLRFNWYVQLRIDYIDDNVAMALKKSNCTRVYLGVESGSDVILKNVNKGITRKKILESIKALKKVGIRVKTGWIYGLPGSLEEQKKSISLMVESKPNDISIHKLIPFPGTEYYNNSQKYGITVEDSNNSSNFSFSGLNNNIKFEYMTNEEYIELLEETGKALEYAGYVSSDQAVGNEEYIYTTPLNSKSITVVKEEGIDNE